MKIVVFGGRNYNNRQYLYQILDDFHKDAKVTSLVNGKAPGADQLARDWAVFRGLKPLDYPADWNNIDVPGALVRYSYYHGSYNVKAGLDRNQKMLDDNPDIEAAIAFEGGTGTEDMIRRVKKKDVPLFYVFD